MFNVCHDKRTVLPVAYVHFEHYEHKNQTINTILAKFESMVLFQVFESSLQMQLIAHHRDYLECGMNQ